MGQNRAFVVSLLAALLALPLASVATAQGTTATIVGTITDASGAALTVCDAGYGKLPFDQCI